MEAEVKAVIEEIIRPLLQADGGDIELVSAEKDVITIRLLGACGGCPGAPYTRADVIEPLVQQALRRTVRVRFERAPGSD